MFTLHPIKVRKLMYMEAGHRIESCLWLIKSINYSTGQCRSNRVRNRGDIVWMYVDGRHIAEMSVEIKETP